MARPTVLLRLMCSGALMACTSGDIDAADGAAGGGGHVSVDSGSPGAGGSAGSGNRDASGSGGKDGAAGANGSTGGAGLGLDGGDAGDADGAGGSPPWIESKRKVGIYYAVWHWEAWTYMNEARSQGVPQWSIEEVLRSRVESGPDAAKAHQFSEMRVPGIEVDAQNFYYQYDPQPGFYCIYHRRQPGDVNYNASFEGDYGLGQRPDCPMYKDILAAHARQITDLGVDFVYVDMTNPADYTKGSDAIQTRPFEVLTEEWQALGEQGQRVPRVVAWQRLPQKPALPTDGHDYAIQHVLAVYNDAKHEKSIMRDPASGKKILLYVGDGDNVDPAWEAFVEDNGGRKDVIAIPMWGPTDTQWCAAYVCRAGERLDDKPCDQPYTPHSKLGVQTSVTPKYQSPFWASLPFDTVGVHGGLTLRKQFWSALEQNPDWLLIYGWNEQIAQVQHSNKNVPSLGFESDPTVGDSAFIDVYGVEYTRDIEPSKQYGSLLYDITQSCLRLFRNGGTKCDDQSSLCCQGGNFSDNFAYVDGQSGLFEIYATQSTGPNRAPLYQCARANGNVFYSLDAACEGETFTNQLGQLSTVKGGYALRALRRCRDGNGDFSFSLLGQCGSGSLDRVLGYVR